MARAGFGGNEVQRLVDDLGKVPKDIQRDLRPALRRAAQPILQDAKARASWSTRIPGATRIGASFRRRGAGVEIRVDSRRAPHARPMENRGKGGAFRHPVFGDRDMWVSQAARPFLHPALVGRTPQVQQEIGRVIDTVLRDHGFR